LKAVETITAAGITREALLETVRARVPNADEVAENIGTLWDEARELVDRDWDDRWRELAPGADVLERVWSKYGLHFHKEDDGRRIATLMSEPPEELLNVVETFIGANAEPSQDAPVRA
jgi:hypothetical protein